MSIHGPRGFITSSMSPSNNRYGITWIPASITPLACLLSPENLYSVIIWTEPLPIALWVTNDARPIYDHNFQFWDRKVARIEAIVDKWNDMVEYISIWMIIYTQPWPYNTIPSFWKKTLLTKSSRL